MKNLKIIGCGVLLIALCSLGSNAQHVSIPGEAVICYASNETNHSYIAPDQEVIERLVLKRSGKLTETATFEIDFIEVPVAGQSAIKYAADIWAVLINSAYPIKIKVTWTDLSEGVLGSARPASREANFVGAPVRSVWYPIALAERLARKELNEPEDYEIIISLNKEFSWYYGLDGQPTTNTHDLLSVALHEIGHGLGLSDTFNSDGGSGSWGWEARANIYDFYIVNDSGLQLIDGDNFKNYSTALNAQITSDRVEYGSRSARNINNEYPKIYAPKEFDGGSSISHLDEKTYPAGDTNSLMSPKLSREEAIHNTGPLVNAILADMGYVWAFIDHDSIPDQLSWLDDIDVTGSIASDSVLLEDSAFLVYSFDDFVTRAKVPMGLSANQAEFTTTIPAPGFKTFVDYYFTVVGRNNISYRSPVTISEANYRFGFGLVTGISENEHASNRLHIYPNPTDGRLTLQYELAAVTDKLQITAINLQGKTIYSEEIMVNSELFEHQIMLSEQASGVYIIQIQTQNTIIRKPIIIR